MIPLVQPVVKGRDRREGGRQMHVFFSSAQARAMELGRPVGVWFERDVADATKSSRLYLAEVPPPYSGESTASRARIEFGVDKEGNPIQDEVGLPTGRATFILDDLGSITEGVGSDLVAPPYVNAGDLIQFDHKGPLYTIETIAPGIALTFRLSDNQQYSPPRMESVSYQIFRGPRKKSSAPLILPPNVSIELGLSGFGANGVECGLSVLPAEPIILMFKPDGTIDRIYPHLGNVVSGLDITSNRGKAVLSRMRAPGSLYFFVGRSDQDALSNLRDTNSLWISVGHRSGTVTIAPNATITGADITTAVPEARKLALTSQGMGGL